MHSSVQGNEDGRGTFPWIEILFVAGILVLLICLILPAFPGRHPSHGRLGACANNMKQIGFALQSYHDTYKCFPPAYVTDADGKPMHSWRVLLLPFFDVAGVKSLYEQYNFSEPWNGPHNSKLAFEFPILFCPSEEGDFLNTSYVAVVGPETAWPGSDSMRIRGITDGMSKTISVVEVSNSGIHWMEPRDLTFDEALRGINAPGNKIGISSKHPGGANILFCDGAVHFLPDTIPADTLRALLTANGGEDVKIPDD